MYVGAVFCIPFCAMMSVTVWVLTIKVPRSKYWALVAFGAVSSIVLILAHQIAVSPCARWEAL